MQDCFAYREEKITKPLACCAVIGLLSLASAALAQAPGWTPLAESQRCPSKWGAGDERGAANHQKPAAILNAAKLIKTGEAIELGHVLSPSMPLVGTRRFDVHTKRTFMNMAPSQRGSNEELVVTELGQVGTQFDGFTHQSIGDQLYNCFKIGETGTRAGFNKLGIHHVGQLFTQGVLIDVAAAEWLIRQDPMLLDSDNTPVEVLPSKTPNANLPVHQIALAVNGVFLLENLKLEELAAKQVHEFAFVMQPLKIEGGTGSTVAPVAIR